MGTRSRLCIRRHHLPNVWVCCHDNGDLERAGAILCRQLREFLTGRSRAEAAALVASMTVRMPEGATYTRSFDYGTLASVLSGATPVVHDPRPYGIEFEYVLDVTAGVLAGWPTHAQPHEHVYVTLEDVRAGTDLCS